MNARIIFSSNMKNYRRKAGFTQEELAEKAGFHRTYIGSVERAERNVSIDAMEKIALALDLSIDQLFKSGNNDV